MYKFIPVVLLALAGFFGNIGWALIPVEDFAKPSRISGARLSPDGKWLAFRYPSGDRMDLMVFNLDE
ncbi:MAG: hypothetical protein MK080_12265 [Opitutales bacterium]|nr:hypothetical protein [Opitutales bacterium]NRA26318.1 hypothetical protein [Opitutales bacterium]